MKKTLCFVALASLACAQTLEVTSKLGRKFYSLPDPKGVVAEAQKNAGDPLKIAQAQILVWQDKEAVATLTQGLAVTPNNTTLLTERGHRYLPLRDFSNAKSDLQRAADLHSKDMATYYHLPAAAKRQMGIEARNKVLENFTRERIAGIYLEKIEALTSAHYVY